MKSTDSFPDFVTGFTEASLPFDGASAWFVRDDHHQIAFAQVDEATEVPEHFHIPAGVPHAATVAAGYRAIIVFNEPDRYSAK